MRKRYLYFTFAVLISIFIFHMPRMVHAQSPSISNGLNWLISNQASDGSWGSETTTNDIAPTTSAVVESLILLNAADSQNYSNAVSWFSTQRLDTTRYLSERLQILSTLNTDKDTILLYLDELSRAWGGFDDFAVNNLDTAFALHALKAANYSDLSVINSSLAYLTLSQNSDGGWGFSRGDSSNLYMTALISATLQQFPQMTSIATAVSKATTYLLAHQNADGGFGNSPSTVYETSLAYAALVAVSSDVTVLGGAVNYLTATQASNGSWNDDPYSTALALKALHLAENKPLPPPPPETGGRLTGTVMDAATNIKLSGVFVALENNQLINTTTDSSGNFTLNDVPAGTQTVTFSLTDYDMYTKSVNVADRAIISMGSILMISKYSTGTIKGTVIDEAGLPLPDVAIAVTGAWSGSAMTGADGTFLFTYVTPGEVTISAAKAGYQTATGSGTVFARTTLSFSPRLSTAPPQVITGSLIGRVVDDQWGLPISPLPGEPGVTITVSGGVTAAPNDQGYFTIQGLAPNTYQVTVGMNGFVSQTFRVIVTAGVTTDMQTIRLVMSASSMTLTGRVTNATTGNPISGAEVTVMGTDLTGRTDFAGTYVIANITYSEFTLKASATGYNSKSYLVGGIPFGTQTMNITLSPQITTGTLTGTVVNASTNQPLNGVTVTLVDDASVSTTTSSSGTFTLSPVMKGTRQMALSLAGYPQLKVTAAVTAGAVNNIGKVGMSTSLGAAMIQGTVWDAVVNAPFSGVEIMATGTGFWQTVSAANGTFKISNVNPGTVTVAATAGPKPGYYGARLTAPLAPGGVLIFNPSLSTTPPPGTLKGAVTDYSDNHPIQGATIALNPAPEGVEPAFTDLSGAFSISGIPVGTYTASFTAPDYARQNVTVNIISGYLGDTSVNVKLMKPATSSTISGTVKDEATGNPIAGAEVSITGTNISALTDSNGNYSLTGIKTMILTIRGVASGYDERVYSFTLNAYGEYQVPFTLAKTGSSTTTVFGTVLDAATNSPIAGAEVSIRGTEVLALTDSAGKYRLSGLTDMVLNVKASATGYDTKYYPLSVNAFGDYELSFALDKSRLSTVVINGLSADKQTYSSNALVNILSEIENTGDAQVQITATAQISDQNGNVLAVIPYAEAPAALDPQSRQTLVFQWNTGRNVPGAYQIKLTIVDNVYGGVLAESAASIAIDSTANVDGLVSMISPKFVNVKATETIAVSAYLVNRSNVDASLSASFDIRDPGGTVLKDGTVDFSLAASEEFKVISLTDFTQTFSQSGQYPLNIKILSGAEVIDQISDAIYVAPSIRIEPVTSLEPTTVVPDGDREIRLNIQIKGVEDLR